MKILVTGGAGYIGSLLAYHLIKEGHDVSILDNLVYNQKSLERLDYSLGNGVFVKETLKMGQLGEKKAYSHFKFANIDTTDKIALTNFFDGDRFDIVFHLAELVGVPVCNQDPIRTRKINFEGTKNVIDLTERMGAKLIYNSSSSVYGLQKTDALVDEDAEIPEPTDEYVRNKLLVEEYLRTKGKLNYIITRPATVGGLSFRMRTTLLPHHFVYAGAVDNSFILSNPGHYRAVIHIDDLVSAYLAILANHKNINNQIYNLGNNKLNLKKVEFLKMISDRIPEFKVTTKYGYGDIRNLRISSDKFSRDFGFIAAKGFDEMITPLIELYTENPTIFEGEEFDNVPLSVRKELMG